MAIKKELNELKLNRGGRFIKMISPLKPMTSETISRNNNCESFVDSFFPLELNLKYIQINF